MGAQSILKPNGNRNGIINPRCKWTSCRSGTLEQTFNLMCLLVWSVISMETDALYHFLQSQFHNFSSFEIRLFNFDLFVVLLYSQ